MGNGDSDYPNDDVVMVGDLGSFAMLPASLRRMGPSDRVTMRAIGAKAAEIMAAQDELAALVEGAREDRISWGAIGFVLGMTGEGARQRYGVES